MSWEHSGLAVCLGPEYGRLNSKLREISDEFDTLVVQGRVREALDSRERFATVEKEYYMMPSLEVSRTVSSLNARALRALKEGDEALARRNLNKAMMLTEQDNIQDKNARLELRAMTLNNLCCYHSHAARLDLALHSLAKCLAIELQLLGAHRPGSRLNVMTTSFNMTSLLIRQRKPREALVHARRAFKLSTEEYSAVRQLDGPAKRVDSHGVGDDAENHANENTMEHAGKGEKHKCFSIGGEEARDLRAFACHQVAVTYEHMKEYPQARRYYDRALKYPCSPEFRRDVELAIGSLSSVVKST